jgi:ribosomal protein S27E
MREVVANTTIIVCPFCGSQMVKHDSALERDTKLYHHMLYNVKCDVCGATGCIEQKWDQKEN